MARKEDVFNDKDSNEYETPQDLFDQLNSEYHFTLDVCADKQMAKCDNYYTIDNDALQQDWGDNICWMNPPYSYPEIENFMEKAYLASQSGATVVCLVNASTCSKWWHEYAVKGEIYYIRGRLRFLKHGKQQPAYNRDSVVIVSRPPGRKSK